AAAFDLLAVVINSILSLLAPPPPGIADAQAYRVGQFVGACVCNALYLLAVVLVFLGAWRLTQLRGKGMVITALVVCVIIMFIMLFGAGANVFVLVATPQVVAQIGRLSPITTIVLNTIAALLDLGAAVWVGIILCN